MKVTEQDVLVVKSYIQYFTERNFELIYFFFFFLHILVTFMNETGEHGVMWFGAVGFPIAVHNVTLGLLLKRLKLVSDWCNILKHD